MMKVLAGLLMAIGIAQILLGQVLLGVTWVVWGAANLWLRTRSPREPGGVEPSTPGSSAGQG